MGKDKLSRNYTLDEFLYSETAIEKGIDNTQIPEEAKKRLRLLCGDILQAIRDYYQMPIKITSGWRCPALNRAVGGVSDSLHVTGDAGDIVVLDIPAIKVFQDITGYFIINEDGIPIMDLIDEVVWYPDENRIHIARSNNPKKEMWICRKANGKKIYEKYKPV